MPKIGERTSRSPVARRRLVMSAAACLAVVTLLVVFGQASPRTAGPAAVETPRSSPVAASVVPESGHEQMLALLAQVAEASATQHPILGDGRARHLRGLVADLGSAPPSASAVNALAQLGDAELKLDNLEEGAKHLSKMYRSVKQLHADGAVELEALANAAYRLATAYMRLGETRNCCVRNTIDSCIVPIRGDGVHTDQRGSRKAISLFDEVLTLTEPGSSLHLRAMWLLNVMYMTIGGYPEDVPAQHLVPMTVFESQVPFPRFRNVAGTLGLDTFDLLGGAIIDDLDGDDRLDIMVSTYDPGQPMKLFRNIRDGSFSDCTSSANLEGILGGFNLVQADYDNDGDTDVLVLRGAWMGEDGRLPNSLLRNDGSGRFEDVTFESGLGDVHYPTQTAAWADYDNDGNLDLYVGNEPTSTGNSPCQLFHNRGDGTFTDVARDAGVRNDGFAKGVAWGDYDGDNYPDLYVSNLQGANRLYRNNGNGTFTDVAEQLGVSEPIWSFPAWFWDFDNDGALDIYVSGYPWSQGNLSAVVASMLDRPVEHEHARLYRGDGRGGFTEVAEAQGLEAIHLPMGANFGDLDNDGYLDFYLGTGYPDYEALMPNVMYRNRGGTGFDDVTMAGGFGHLQKGHAVVFADIDNDGDQDVFQQVGGFFPGDRYYNALFENPGSDNHWIVVHLVGRESNRSAIGARIRVDVREGGEMRTIYKYVNSGGSFGANPLRQAIGLGRASHIEALTVQWPAGDTIQRFSDVPMDRSIRITEGHPDYTVIRLR